ncbi:unnamed protein product [Gemmataceae bacterium]|nr:unnamed protein product [Gemmataceae bacterium]VTT98887.1 unnamed protein product [Gemmataceae bacterium]
MTTEDALVRAILDSPEEDGPRLAYADYLDETPSPKRRARAEFIRLQVGFSKGAAFDRELLARESAALRKFGSAWLPRWGRREVGPAYTIGYMVFVTRVGGGEMNFSFKRGFVNSCTAQIGEGMGLVPEGVGEFVRDTLAAHPVEKFFIYWAGSMVLSVHVAHGPGGWTGETKRDRCRGLVGPVGTRREFVSALVEAATEAASAVRPPAGFAF